MFPIRLSQCLWSCVELGPHIVVLKTHIDIISDFGKATISGLKEIASRHDFLLFEDRKLVDIGSTVQKQYHGGTFKISEWAHIVNLSLLPGDGIAKALNEVVTSPDFPYSTDERGFLILAEMTSKGSTAMGMYTSKCIDAARLYPDSMIGFITVNPLAEVKTESEPAKDEDFVIFTTGINISTSGDKLGQQYQSPIQAVGRGADFIIAGRGIYAAADPVAAAKQYQQEGWEEYIRRTAP
jgi:orotidine-5'-phosphate decarboxylase